tara:strand:+ start:759 stop:1799 length:1041 start_codon:yes stop_codon:yes gene_type:complete
MTVEKSLLKWYNFNKRDLPWRKNTDAYRIWVSEIILQQTKISNGKKYFINFIDKFPTINHLAEATEEQVLKKWEGLGYYNRAINLHKTSKTIVKNFNGNFPDSYDELIKLKGIGDYTASAISSICFNKYNPVIDGNVLRFLSRFYGIKRPIDSITVKKEIKQIAYTLIIKTKSPGDFNQAMMEYGALVCKPFPDCVKCIFKTNCISFKNNEVKLLPIKSKNKKKIKRYLNYLVFIDSHKKTLIKQRIKKDIWYKLFEFPLIEQDKLINDIKSNNEFNNYLNENNIQIDKFEKDIYTIKHILSHQTLFISFHIINTKDKLNNGVEISSLTNFTLPVPIIKFIDKCLI